jgi:hypothetical protein
MIMEKLTVEELESIESTCLGCDPCGPLGLYCTYNCMLIC